MPISLKKTKKRTLLVACGALVIALVAIAALALVLTQPRAIEDPYSDDIDYRIPIEWSGQDGTLSASTTGTISVGKPRWGKRAMRVDLTYCCDQDREGEVPCTEFWLLFELGGAGDKVQDVRAYYTLMDAEGTDLLDVPRASYYGDVTEDRQQALVYFHVYHSYEEHSVDHRGTLSLQATLDESCFARDGDGKPLGNLTQTFVHVEHLRDDAGDAYTQQSDLSTTVYLTNPEDAA